LNPKSLSPKPKSFFSERGKSQSKERKKKDKKKKTEGHIRNVKCENYIKKKNNLWSHKKQITPFLCIQDYKKYKNYMENSYFYLKKY